MKRHSFDANEVDESRLNELKDKLKLTFAAIMRDAIKLLHKKEIQNVSKVLFVVALCIASASCGGQIPKMPINPIHVATPTPTPVPVNTSQAPIIITSDQIFKNIAETWTFQNGFGDLSWVDVNPVDANHSIWHYHKNATEAYWDGGTPQAELWFYLEKDAAGNWYSTGGIMNAPEGDNPVLMVTYPVNTKPGNARPYLILPAATGFSYSTLFDDIYPIGGTTLKTDVNTVWATASYTEQVSIPFFTGLAYVSDQTEGTCIREKWYFAPGMGMVKVSPLECPGVDPRLDNIRIY